MPGFGLSPTWQTSHHSFSPFIQTPTPSLNTHKTPDLISHYLFQATMDVWSWICGLPNPDEWSESHPSLVRELATASPSPDSPAQSIQLRAERTAGSDSDALITFSVCVQGFHFHPSNDPKTLWVSDACPLSSEKPFLPLLLQLLQEVISRAPLAPVGTCLRPQPPKLRPDPVSRIMDSHSPESFSGFFDLVLLTRLFWLCACDAPSEVGSLYFHQVLAPKLEALSCEHAPVLRALLISVGADAELCFTRAVSYMLAKWLILREVGAGLLSLAPVPSHSLGLSYANESHGFWVLKGFAPVLSMRRTCSSEEKKYPTVVDAKESVLRYALAHQQLEAVIQLEYSVGFCDRYIQVSVRVNNIRLHVAKLGFDRNGNDEEYGEERHFPSRIHISVGPEVGSTYVTNLSLARSTDNMEREVEIEKILKGSFEKSKLPTRVRVKGRTTTKTRLKSWRWNQDVEGNTVKFDAILYDNTNGFEIATWKASNEGSGKPYGIQNQYVGASGLFTKTGGLIFAGDECGEGVVWRLGKEMEGSVLKWRLGGKIWLTYLPKNVKSSYHETRCVEWWDEVDLPLIS
ncbi:uncharacterized protein LOC131155354 [Malania oleifera]|uniref:uncharacterized protein LOC131155354 n=1 Tax=Malania oleifera TaxID=397392 RepID=UPI0025AE092C|nr:uncharacterized protein LOC131155354 [Malania oleifera]